MTETIAMAELAADGGVTLALVLRDDDGIEHDIGATNVPGEYRLVRDTPSTGGEDATPKP